MIAGAVGGDYSFLLRLHADLQDFVIVFPVRFVSLSGHGPHPMPQLVGRSDKVLFGNYYVPKSDYTLFTVSTPLSTASAIRCKLSSIT